MYFNVVLATKANVSVSSRLTSCVSYCRLDLELQLLVPIFGLESVVSSPVEVWAERC